MSHSESVFHVVGISKTTSHSNNGELVKHMNGELSRSGVAAKYWFRLGDNRLNRLSSLRPRTPRPKGDRKSRNSLYFGKGLKSAAFAHDSNVRHTSNFQFVYYTHRQVLTEKSS